VPTTSEGSERKRPLGPPLTPKERVSRPCGSEDKPTLRWTQAPVSSIQPAALVWGLQTPGTDRTRGTSPPARPQQRAIRPARPRSRCLVDGLCALRGSGSTGVGTHGADRPSTGSDEPIEGSARAAPLRRRQLPLRGTPGCADTGPGSSSTRAQGDSLLGGPGGPVPTSRRLEF